MIRGTTAQFKFSIAPYVHSQIADIKVSFWQYDKDDITKILEINKGIDDCYAGKASTEVYVDLTPTETLKFSDESKAYVQFKALGIDGLSFGSKQRQITVYPMHDETALSDSVVGWQPPVRDYILLDGDYI